MTVSNSEFIHAQEASYKHPLNKVIGFTENSIEVDSGTISYELIVTNPTVVGISYQQILRIPKLPHTMPHIESADKNVAELTAKLKLTPPADIAITSIKVENKNNQIITVNAGYGVVVEKSTLLFDEKTVAYAGLNAKAITITGKKKSEDGTESPEAFTAHIPIYRVDSIGEHLKFITKKIKDEGVHDNDYGSASPNKPAGAGEQFFYFRPQDTNPVLISCIGYPNHVLRHGFQKWRGAYEPILKPLIVPNGVDPTSGVAYAHTITNRDGWQTYYLSIDNKTEVEHTASLANVTITKRILNLGSSTASQAELTALLTGLQYAYGLTPNVRQF